MSPDEGTPIAGNDRQYVAYARMPPDRLISWQQLEVMEGVLRAVSESGLTFRIVLDSGAVEVRSSPEFVAVYERARRSEALSDFLARMGRETKVWRRG
jgi:hypothetical protein